MKSFVKCSVVSLSCLWAFSVSVAAAGMEVAAPAAGVPGKVMHVPLVANIVTIPTREINHYNLGLFDTALDQYVKSGEYEHDLSTVDNTAETYLAERVQENLKSPHPKKLALVLDIDETSLSNMAVMQDLSYGYSPAIFDAAVDKAQDPALKPTLKLYRYALAHGVSVFFITGRKVNLTAVTEKNLKAVGYTTWSALDLAPMSYHQHSIIPFKSSMRAKIESEGYDIALNVGDQYSDLEGGHADRGYKLPDPFYYIP